MYDNKIEIYFSITKKITEGEKVARRELRKNRKRGN